LVLKKAIITHNCRILL